MLNIKKYANGRFFNTDTKKYIKSDQLAEMVKKGKEIKVILTKTGKDITEDIIKQFTENQTGKKTKKSIKKELPFIKTDKLVKWVGEIIDTKINQVLEIVKLPSKEQVAQLDENIQALNKKIDALNLATGKKKAAKPKTAKKTRPAAKKTAAPKKEEPVKTEAAKTEPAGKDKGPKPAGV